VLGKLLLLFTVVPIVELYLLISIGQLLGAVPTLAIVLVTGLIGAGLAKHEGIRVLRTWQGALARGEVPQEGVVSSLLVLVGGVLLVTPGVLSDIVGLALLIPGTRRAVARMIQRRVQERFEIHTVHSLGAQMFTGAGAASSPEQVIDLPTDDVREH
jgi:UPF0716 protein FxsA